MAKRFTVWDNVFAQESSFPSEARADAYLLRRRNEVMVDMRRDEPGRHWDFCEVFCAEERKEYWLMENDEVYGIIFAKWPAG